MQSQDALELREKLTALRLEHSDLDTKLASSTSAEAADQLHITRLKKRKLQIKDNIAALENQLFPDIIA